MKEVTVDMEIVRQKLSGHAPSALGTDVIITRTRDS